MPPSNTAEGHVPTFDVMAIVLFRSDLPLQLLVVTLKIRATPSASPVNTFRLAERNSSESADYVYVQHDARTNKAVVSRGIAQVICVFL